MARSRNIRLVGNSTFINSILEGLTLVNESFTLQSVTDLCLKYECAVPAYEAPYLLYKNNANAILDTPLVSFLSRHSPSPSSSCSKSEGDEGKKRHKIIETLRLPWCQVGYSSVSRILLEYVGKVKLEGRACRGNVTAIGSSSSSSMASSSSQSSPAGN